MIANPYVSTIDWSSATGWAKSGLNDTVYLWDAVNSQYTTYVGGIGSNGGSEFIPSTQAFWVQTNRASPTMQIHEDAKTANDVAIRSMANSENYFKMTIRSENDLSDELAIRIHPDTNDYFDPSLDALELGSSNIGIPGICVKGFDEKDYSIYSYAHEAYEKLLLIAININEAGRYKISFENLDLCSDYSCLVLYDNYTEETGFSGAIVVVIQNIADDTIVTKKMLKE